MFPLLGRRTFAAALRDASHPRPGVRRAALGQLGTHVALHRAEVVSRLSEALGAREPAPEVRSAAALALADAGATEAAGALCRAAESDEVAEVRAMALAALGELGAAEAEPTVSRALADPLPEIRFQAVMAFVRLCPERSRAEEALVRATEDEDDFVRHVALRMAEELGSAAEAAGPAPARAEPGVVPSALLERAEQLLDDPSADVQLASAIILGRSGRSSGDELLVAAVEGRLRSSHSDDDAAAIELCGERGLRDAIGALERRGFGSRWLGTERDPLAWLARVALARLGHARAVDEVLRDLRSRNRTRRTLAVAAVGRARLEQARSVLVELRTRPGLVEPEAVDDALARLGPLTER